MNPETEPTKTPQAPVTHQPKFWNAKVQASWAKAKQQAVADWDKLADAHQQLEHALAEEAIAFGHGARHTYKKLQAWSGDVEEKLKADWKASHQTDDAWDKVRDAVKHGWGRTTDAVKAALPKNP